MDHTTIIGQCPQCGMNRAACDCVATTPEPVVDIAQQAEQNAHSLIVLSEMLEDMGFHWLCRAVLAGRSWRRRIVDGKSLAELELDASDIGRLHPNAKHEYGMSWAWQKPAYDLLKCRVTILEREADRSAQAEGLPSLSHVAVQVLKAQDQHGGPYPQYPELHAAIDNLRRVLEAQGAYEEGSDARP